MASKLKQALINYFSQNTHSKCILPDLQKATLQLTLMKTSKTKVRGALRFYNINNSREKNPAVFKDFKLHQNEIRVGEAVREINFIDISYKGTQLQFEMSKSDFIEDVLHSNPIEVAPLTKKNEKILVEFSSPNIAKQFHVGHLRSTMIGNFVANILKKIGNDVVKINYLGDWGTQCGMLMTGIDLLGYTEESLDVDTLVKLNNAYVHANKMAVQEEWIELKAREIFQKLENGDYETMEKWQKIKKWSETALEQLYKKLDVEFDEYDWESLYGSKKAETLLNDLEKNGILIDDENGRKTVELNGNRVPLLKSDGTSLYLLRDVLAFFDRKKRHRFNKLYYVVDYSQGKHFSNLKRVCELIEPGTSDLIEHVQVGRILRMSTRTGTNILLNDVLSEARERMYEKQSATETTKGSPSMEIAEILGRSALIIYDFNQGKDRHYEFDWNGALNAKANSGIRLQYVHCRLCSLIKNSKEEIPNECDPTALDGEAVPLILAIAGFEDAVHAAGIHLEPSILTNYLFELTTLANSAISALSVRKADPHIARQRLYLFHSTRLVVAEGLRLLGLPALQEM